MSKKPLHDLRKTRLDDLFAGLDPDPVPQESASESMLAGWTWEADSDGRYTACSAEVQTVLGVDPASFIGQLLVEWQLSPASSANLQTALSGAEYPLVVTVEYLSHSGDPIPVTLHILPPRRTSPGNGKARGLHGFVQAGAVQAASSPSQPPMQPDMAETPSTTAVLIESPAPVVSDEIQTPPGPPAESASDRPEAYVTKTGSAETPTMPIAVDKPAKDQRPPKNGAARRTTEIPTTPREKQTGSLPQLPTDTGALIDRLKQSSELPTRPVTGSFPGRSPISPPSQPRPSSGMQKWSDGLAPGGMAFRDDETGTRQLPLIDALSPSGQESLLSGEAVIQDAGPSSPAVLAQPALLEGGNASLLLEILDDEPNRQWTGEERALVEQITDQLALALDNARLFQQNLSLLSAVEMDRQRYSDLYNHAPDCYFSIDADGLFIEFNQTGLGWLGYTRDDLVGRLKVADVLAPYSRQTFATAFSAMQQTGRLQDIEVEFLRKDGTTFPVLIDASAQFDATGNFSQARTIARDITRLRQVELRQRQLARAIEATADMVVITDRNGDITFANPAAEQITGYSREEMLGHNPRVLKSGQQQKSFYEKMWSVILSGQVWRGELVNRRKNGAYYYAQLTISPMTNERGEINQFIAVQRDITAQKRAEAEREKLLNETEILYNASGELNAARTYDDILSTLRRFTIAGNDATLLNLCVFDRPWVSGNPPQWVDIAARWSKTGPDQIIESPTGHVTGSLETRSPLKSIASLARLMRPDLSLVIEDITTDPRVDEATRDLYLKRYAVTTLIFVPIVVSSRWLGFINAGYAKRTKFSEADVRRLSVISNQASVAFQNIRLLEEARIRNDELSTLNTIIATASRSLNPESMLSEILDQVLAIIDYQAGLISVADPITHSLRLVAQRNLPEALHTRLSNHGLDGTLCDLVYRRGEVIHIANLNESPPMDLTSLVNMGLRSYLGVPLESKGRILGTVCVFGHHVQAGTPANLPVLQAVGQQVGVAIENAMLFAQTQTALNETETLYQAGAELNAAQSYHHILAAVRKYTLLGERPAVGAIDAEEPTAVLVVFDSPWTSTYTPENMEILSMWHPQAAAVTTPRRFPLKTFRWLMENFRPDAPLFVEDTARDSSLDEFSRNWAERTGFKSVILVPLVVGGQWRGFMGAFFNTPSDFPETEQRSLMSLAGQAAVAVQNLQSIELAESRARVAQRRSDELALVNSIISTIAGSLDLQTSLEVICKNLGQALNVQTGIALHNEERQVLTIVATYNSEDGPQANVTGIDLPLQGNPSSQEVLRTRKTLVVENAQTNPLTGPVHEVMLQRGVETLMIIPMVSGNQVIGTVGLDILEKGRSFLPDEIALAETIVFQAATAIQNARLFEQTEQALAETETLYNASAELSSASTFDDILSVVRRYTILGAGTRNVTLAIFDQPPQTGTLPDWLPIAARWALSPADELPGPRYDLNGLASARHFFKPDTTVTVVDAVTDERLDLTARQLFLDYFEASSLLFTPVVVSGSWVGHILGVYLEPARFTDKALRRLTTLVGQAAVAVQNIRLLEDSRRRAEQLQTAAVIARDASSTLTLDTLLSRAVRLICEDFGYYHASIFLVDGEGNAVVRASTGQAGEEMKHRGHLLPVGSRSVIGYVTDRGEPLVINDVLLDAIHKPNPLLPDTRAESGIPLKLAGRVIGALDLQASHVNAFRPEDISVLQILADQIAVAVDNARAYELSQNAVEEMRKADQLKSQFLANMSHELRTPLNSIIGFSRVIIKGIDGPVTELQQQDLNAIYNSGQHLLNLINDILDLSKIEAGKMELSIEDNVNIADIINSVLSTVVGLIKDKPIQLNKEIAVDLPVVRADPLKVRQILINLLSNAAKFTDEGSITLRAFPVAGERGLPEVRIEVQDTGPGIALEDQSRLFLPFSQVDGSPTRKTGGSGLGLSICRHLVEMHGGRIDLSSQAGQGSTFYFTLPMQPARKLTGSLALPPEAPLVLAIDDERQILHLYERYLHSHGYRVIGVNDPALAVAAARQHHPAAITLDVMMPGRDGWQVLSDLKSDPITRDIPVIMCTILEEQGKGFSLGATDYLMKPILEDDLVQALNRLNKNGESREILLIDTDPDDRRMVQKVFQEHPEYRLVLVESGAKALTNIRTRPPDAILLDVNMPDLDGFTLLETLRADPGLADIPVIIISAGNLSEEENTRLALISQAMLTRGLVSSDELFSALETSLKRLHR